MKLMRRTTKKANPLPSTKKRSSSSKAMKAVEELHEEEEPFDDEDEEEKDEISHLAEKISRAWIRRIKKKRVTPKKDEKGKTK